MGETFLKPGRSRGCIIKAEYRSQNSGARRKAKALTTEAG
jgi:hypothetical protein